MKSILVFLVLLIPMTVHAQLDCIVSTRELGFEANRPGAESLRRAARAVEAITKKNAVLMAGNKPVRVRTTISYYGWDWLSASVITTAYNKTAWIEGGCKVSPNADRGRSLADGSIAIFINDPDAMLGGQIGDAELHASRLPRRLTTMAGFPVYAVGGNEQNPRALLTRSGYLPWTQVTEPEIVAWQARKNQPRQSSGSDFDEAKIEEIVREMKKVNAVEAEKARVQMMAALAKMREQSARQNARAAELEAARAKVLEEQTKKFVDETPLAKVDPGYVRRNPNQIHLIVVGLAPQPKTDPEYEWQQASYEALNFAALMALVE
jgi:ElaB/YqjD/DUF883 family membrane-anchored ribosome-binding protein